MGNGFIWTKAAMIGAGFHVDDEPSWEERNLPKKLNVVYHYTDGERSGALGITDSPGIPQIGDKVVLPNDLIRWVKSIQWAPQKTGDTLIDIFLEDRDPSVGYISAGSFSRS